MTSPYSDRQVSAVREAFVSGQYSSVAGLATAFSIHRSQIHRWRRKGNWDSDRARVNAESAQVATAAIVADIAKSRESHIKTWQKFDEQIEAKFKHYNDLGQPIPLDELKTMAVIQEMSQRGCYKALGDVETTEIVEARTEIVYSGLEDAIAAARESGGLPSPVPDQKRLEPGETPDDRIPLTPD